MFVPLAVVAPEPTLTAQNSLPVISQGSFLLPKAKRIASADHGWIGGTVSTVTCVCSFSSAGSVSGMGRNTLSLAR
jgi:hypothetical protein